MDTGLKKLADWAAGFPNFPSRDKVKAKMEQLLAEEQLQEPPAGVVSLVEKLKIWWDRRPGTNGPATPELDAWAKVFHLLIADAEYAARITTCGKCGGHGKLPGSKILEYYPCDKCKGKGWHYGK